MGGRGRGKGRRLTVTSHDDAGSGEEEKIPAQKRRGRPQKPLKDEIDEEEAEMIEDDDDIQNLKGSEIVSKEIKGSPASENGKRRRRNSLVKEKLDSVKDENGDETRPSTDISNISNGFRHNGSRRKSKPHRAAEAGVNCR